MIPTSGPRMQGLRLVRDAAAEAPATEATHPARSDKYMVAERLGRWRVQLNEDQDAGAFASLDDAVHFACAQARKQAKAGVLGVVVVRSDIQEMHCFTPPSRVPRGNQAEPGSR